MEKINHVYQYHYSGCFIASIAMILHTSYDEAFKLVFGKDADIRQIDWQLTPSPKNRGAALTIEQAMLKLSQLGIYVHKSKYVNINNLHRYGKHALLIINFKQDNLAHAIVFDGVQKEFFDPFKLVDFRTKYLKPRYQDHLDEIILIN